MIGRKIGFIVIALSLLVMCNCGTTYASVLLDTGTPKDTWGWAVINKDGAYQSLAAEFSVGGAGWNITDIEGYFYMLYPGNININISGDAGEHPSTTIFYSGSFTLLSDRGWMGVHDITNVKLSPGTYWVVFNPGSNGVLGCMPTNSPNPLINESYYTPQVWTERDSLNLGIKISGDSAVPEPATMALFGLGLAGFLRTIKRKRS